MRFFQSVRQNRPQHSTYELDKFGFDTDLCLFLQSYLTNRSQYRLFDFYGYKSNSIVATSGILQSSVISALFFHVYIDDIVVNLTVQHLLYADEMTFHEKSEYKTLVDLIENIQKWCTRNGLFT